jgi:thiosulfate dehydrogenase
MDFLITMKKFYIVAIFIFVSIMLLQIISCHENKNKPAQKAVAVVNTDSLFYLDTLKIPKDKFGEAVRYGRELMLHTAYYIGPNGINGKYTGNKMSCTNCHQNAGTKPYSFNLQASFQNYPEYRAREGKVLSLAERINNCIMHPHLGVKPLPLDGKEMLAFISYLKWINDSSKVDRNTPGVKNLEISFPKIPASPKRGEQLYAFNCMRCHGADGAGIMANDNSSYVYPTLWGQKAYQPGSSMHRIIKMAQWLVANMPYDKATHNNPFLKADQALDLAAFINDDSIHERPLVKEYQYPNIDEKPIDYDRGSFADPFSVTQHKYGPYQPIIDYWKGKGVQPKY